MKHTEKRIDGYGVIAETFRDFNEFKSIVESRETLWIEEDVPCRDVKHNAWFRGCDTYDEALNMLMYGTNEGVSRMKSRVGVLQKQGIRKKQRRYEDVVGYMPIVPNALLGIPNSMLNSERRPVNSKVITICYEPSVSSFGTQEEVFEFGCQFVNAVMNLEEQGYRVRIDYLKSNITDGRIYFMRIPVKNENQPVNLKRLMFPLTHISMQRYLSWEWLEKLPNSRQMSGYGHSLYAADDREKNVIRQMLDDNEYLIHYNGSNVNDVLKQLDIN